MFWERRGRINGGNKIDSVYATRHYSGEHLRSYLTEPSGYIWQSMHGLASRKGVYIRHQCLHFLSAPLTRENNETPGPVLSESLM